MKTSAIVSAFILSQHLASASPAPAAASSSFAASGSVAPSGSVAVSASAAPSGSAAASFALAPPASVVPSLSVSIAANAIQAPAVTTLASFVSTDQSNDCIKFTENTIKFPGLGSKISGHSWVKMCKDGYYDTYGILRNDDPPGKSHKVGWVWVVYDTKGHYYEFDSYDGCGPYDKLKYKGDVCQWNQNWKYNKYIKKYWKAIKNQHQATGYPIKW